MDEIMRGCAARDVDEIVVGMAHRGRLNLLVNVLGKSPRELFAEFEGKYTVDALSRQGDVRSTLGVSTAVKSEELRVGNECVSTRRVRGWPYYLKKNKQ